MTNEQNIVARHKKTHKPNKTTLNLWQQLKAIADEYDVMTVRQLYYQAEMRHVVGKTDSDYDKVQRAVVQMRRQGFLAYDKIVDSHRERKRMYQHGSMHEALENMYQLYRRNYWLDQPEHVEIWCEKDALTNIINPVCSDYGVSFSALRGFDSESFIYDSAIDLKRMGKPSHVYYFGDHDPSGWWIARNLGPSLRGFGAPVSVHHVAVTPRQVASWQLPTRTAKRTDKRLPGFIAYFGSDQCTEVDAIAPDTLRMLVKRCIMQHIDVEAWERAARDEALERETLESIARAGWKPGHLYAAPGDERAA